MNINLGANIKRLRKAHELTQEFLADTLGVSFQAVSKWERGEGYPDITMLLPLARTFGVSIDELMGADALRDAEEAQKLLVATYTNGSDGKIAENITLLRNGLKRYPNNAEIRTELARNLHALPTDKHNEEAINLLEHVLAHCTDSLIRNRAHTFLCYVYADTGHREKAAHLAHTLPSPLFCQLIEVDFLDGDAQQTALQNAFLSTAEALDWQFHRLYHLGNLSDRDLVEMLQKSLAILNLILNGEYLHLAINIAERHLWLAKAYTRLGEFDNARAALANALKYAKAYDNQPEAYEHQTLPLRGFVFHKNDYSKDTTESYTDWLKAQMPSPDLSPLFDKQKTAEPN